MLSLTIVEIKPLDCSNATSIALDILDFISSSFDNLTLSINRSIFQRLFLSRLIESTFSKK